LEVSVGTLISLAFSRNPLPTVVDRWKDRWNVDFIEFFALRQTVGSATSLKADMAVPLRQKIKTQKIFLYLEGPFPTLKTLTATNAKALTWKSE
jgi:hypothetical protein